jgi:hypothetical protein
MYSIYPRPDKRSTRGQTGKDTARYARRCGAGDVGSVLRWQRPRSPHESFRLQLNTIEERREGEEGGRQGPCLVLLLGFGDMPRSRMPMPQGMRGVMRA